MNTLNNDANMIMLIDFNIKLNSKALKKKKLKFQNLSK